MKRFLVCLSLVMFCAATTAAEAAKTIKLGVVTKPGSAQNIVADKLDFNSKAKVFIFISNIENIFDRNSRRKFTNQTKLKSIQSYIKFLSKTEYNYQCYPNVLDYFNH